MTLLCGVLLLFQFLFLSLFIVWAECGFLLQVLIRCILLYFVVALHLLNCLHTLGSLILIINSCAHVELLLDLL